jgi:lipopolysaccharide/colanic/teichoic acid biosynthesis glycosyltransferase
VALAATTPVVALYLRDIDVGSSGARLIAGSYALVSLVASLISFQVFRINDTIARYFSEDDLLNLTKVVVGAELITAIVLFAINRLDGIPRSLLAIHALILGAGLLASRGLANVAASNRDRAKRPQDAAVENVIVIGLNDWSAFLVKFLKSHTPEHWRVIGLLDEHPQWIGRSVNGVQILGTSAHLEALIEEFATHGVYTDRLLVAGEADELSVETLAQVRGVCARNHLILDFLPHPLAVCLTEHASIHREVDLELGSLRSRLVPLPYYRVKRHFDIVAASVLILFLLPALALAAFIVILDVGFPVLFWQRRSGRDGHELQLYKLRTLRPPFDRRGQRIPEERRLSWIGRLLRYTRIDELPQVLNVLVGDMSLIGPRPLLPRDQPPSAALRLTVRPGITGWAQVNGGTSLSPTEKAALDVWYICNASLWLDLRIIGMTILTLLRGERRSEKALEEAERLLAVPVGRNERPWRQTASSQFAAAAKPAERTQATYTR